jgi:serine/threonine protein kinase
MGRNESDLFAARYRNLIEVSRRPWRLTYRALDSQTNQEVFIKVMGEKAGATEADAQNFFAEPQRLILLNRELPAGMLVPVLDMGVWEGKPYFVQPFLQGWPLHEAMAKKAAFVGIGVLRLMEKCFRILEGLHNAGYAHGDLSPENIFIVTKEPVRTDGILPDEFEVKLIDFEGTRKLKGPESSVIGKMTFKIPYLAPELAATNTVMNPRSDLYAMGIIFYEILTGDRPYPVNSLEDARNLRIYSLASIPRIYEIPELIEEFIYRLIAINPEQRFSSASECLNDLRRLLTLESWLNKTQPSDANRLRFDRAGSRPKVSSVMVERETVQPGTDIKTDFQNLTERREIGSTVILEPGRPKQASSVAERAEVATDSLAPDTGRRKELSTTVDVRLRTEAGNQELLDFSVFGPGLVVPDSSFIVDVWAYGSGQRDEMLARARRDDRIDERGSRGGIRIPIMTDLTLYLELDKFEVDEPAEPFYWNGFVTNVSFIVKAPKNLLPGFYPGRIKILNKGLLLSRLLFEIAVADASEAKTAIEPREIRAMQQKVKTAFASYSSKDQQQVLMRVQGMSHAGLEVFLDVLTLRSGEKWEERIYRAIRENDMFFLFWSNSARESEYVEKEWRFALQERGLEFIHPVPLVDPRLVPPPTELAQLHFGDIFLMYLNYAKNS